MEKNRPITTSKGVVQPPIENLNARNSSINGGLKAVKHIASQFGGNAEKGTIDRPVSITHTIEEEYILTEKEGVAAQTIEEEEEYVLTGNERNSQAKKENLSEMQILEMALAQENIPFDQMKGLYDQVARKHRTLLIARDQSLLIDDFVKAAELKGPLEEAERLFNIAIVRLNAAREAFFNDRLKKAGLF